MTLKHNTLKKVRAFLLFLLLFIPLTKSFSQVRLPQIIRDSMVLQRDTKINIWGWASPKEQVTISFNGKRYRTTTSFGGKWKLVLSAMKAGRNTYRGMDQRRRF